MFNDHDLNNNLAYAADDDQKERLFARVEGLITVVDTNVEKTSGDVKTSLTSFRSDGDGFLHPERGGSQSSHYGSMLDALDDIIDACETAGHPPTLIQKYKGQ